MVAVLNAGIVGTPVNGHDAGPADIAQNVGYAAGASPATEAGVVGPVHLGRYGIPPGEMGSHAPISGNVVTFTGMNDAIADVVDGFSISYLQNGATVTQTLDASVFADVSTLAGLVQKIDAIGGSGPSAGVQAKIDFNGDLQVTTPFLTTLTDVHLTSSTGLPYQLTTVDITGVTDAEAAAVDTFAIKLNGVPLDTSSIDFAAIDDRAELAAALNLLPSISVTESAANGGTITITLESDGPHTFTDISLADLTPNPAVATFGAATPAALDAQVAAAEGFALALNGTAFDLSGLDFGAIDNAAQLAAALDAIDGIAAQLVGATITISSDALGPGNAFSNLALIDNEGASAAYATVTIDNLADYADMVSGFTLSLDSVPVDTSVVEFAAVTDGPSLAAELDKIAGIDVVWSGANGGSLIITASTIGPAVFSDVTLTRLNMLVGDDVLGDVIGAFPLGTWVMGLGGDDHLTGGPADDRLDGGEGNDTLVASGAPDELLGGNGNDKLTGRAGDVLDGGAGDDLIIIDGVPAVLTGGAGDDTVRIIASMVVPDAPDVEQYQVDVAGLTVDFSAASHGIVVSTVTIGDPHVIGSAHDDRMVGFDGNDFFDGGGGDDTFTGGLQDDDLTGGAGTDTAVYRGVRAQYRVEMLGNGDIRVTDLRPGSPDGMDTMRQVERFVFADGTFDAAIVLNDPPTGIVTIAGGATEDQTLTADTTALADQDGLGPLHYQWQRETGAGFVNVGGDQASYTLGDADVGATISVVVSYTDLNGSPEQVTSASTDAVANVNDAPVVGDPAQLTAIGENSGPRLITQGELLANTTDVDGPGLTAINLVIASGAGTLVDNGDRTWSYTPATDDDGAVAFSYQVTDGAATVGHSATLDILPVQSTPSLPVTTGTPGDDGFTAPAGDHRFDALGGIDTITFGFRLIDARVTYSGDQVIVDSASSHTVLTGFERFVFADGTVTNDDGNPLVHDLFYYSRYHDVWSAHADADAHYAAFGWQEGRDPNAFAGSSFLTDRTVNGFDFVYYLRHNPDVAAAGVDPYQHFQTFGWREGRNPNALFDTAGYLAAYRDVAAAGSNPLDHYNAFGWHEGRDPSVGFDTSSYLAAYPDVAAAQVNPLSHFLAFGVHEGRSAFADGVWG